MGTPTELFSGTNETRGVDVLITLSTHGLINIVVLLARVPPWAGCCACARACVHTSVHAVLWPAVFPGEGMRVVVCDGLPWERAAAGTRQRAASAPAPAGGQR